MFPDDLAEQRIGELLVEEGVLENFMDFVIFLLKIHAQDTQ
jgi:hypothetical protein